MARTYIPYCQATAALTVAFLASCAGPSEQQANSDEQLASESSASEVTRDNGVGWAENAVVQLTDSELAAVHLETVRASLRPVSAHLSAMGRVLANQYRKAIVSYPFSARIAEIHVRVGDWVEVGQQLVVLQSEEVGEATAAYYRASADHQLAKLDFERETQLHENGVGARKNLVAAEAALKVAEANLDAAEKKLHVLGFTEDEIQLIRDTHQINPIISLFAPISGKVISDSAVLGEMVDESTEILTIMDPSVLWVDAEIYEKDIAKIKAGQEVAVTVPAYPDDTFQGSVTYISDVLNEDTRTITVRTEVANAGSKLKPGMFANVAISLNHAGEALAVPSDAVVDDRGQHFVFVKRDDRYHPQLVTLGWREHSFIEITSGLEEGDEVVTRGSFQLKSKLYEDVLTRAGVH